MAGFLSLSLCETASSDSHKETTHLSVVIGAVYHLLLSLGIDHLGFYRSDVPLKLPGRKT